MSRKRMAKPRNAKWLDPVPSYGFSPTLVCGIQHQLCNFHIKRVSIRVLDGIKGKTIGLLINVTSRNLRLTTRNIHYIGMLLPEITRAVRFSVTFSYGSTGDGAFTPYWMWMNYKFTLEQPTKPGGGITTLSLTSALDGVGGQRHAPAALPPGNSRYPLYRRLGGRQGRSEPVRKISPSWFDPRTI
jgi:hypothetical protein